MDDCMYANQESSSGCESGWTVYLEHSSINYSYDDDNDNNNRENRDAFLDKARVAKRSEDDDEDEDLSMVSDASSGPPHYNQEPGNFPVIEDKKINRDQKRRRKARDDNVLDDTASSTLFDFSDKSFGLTRNQPENALEYSQGYSSTQFEVTVRPQYHDFFLQPTEPGNQINQNQCFEGKMW